MCIIKYGQLYIEMYPQISSLSQKLIKTSLSSSPVLPQNPQVLLGGAGSLTQLT